MRTYFRILDYGRKYLTQGILAFLSIIVYTLFSVISLFSVIPFLRILFNREEMVAPPADPFLLWDTTTWKAHGYYALSEVLHAYEPGTVLIYFSIALVTAITIKSVARFLSSFFIAPLEQGVIKEMRTRLFSKLTTLDLAFFTRRKKGDLMGLAVSDVQVVQESVIGTLQSVLRDPVMMVVILASMLFLSWELTLFTLVVLPITGLFISAISKRLKRQSRQGQEALGELIAVLDEFISGVRVVRAFQKEAFEQHRYETRNEDYFRLQVSLRRQTEMASPVTEVISIIVICIIIIYSGNLILSQESKLKPDEFIMFIVLFSQFLSPLKTLSTAISKIQKGIAAFLRIEALIDEQPKILPPAHPTKLDTFSQSIRFEGVTFRYDEPEGTSHVLSEKGHRRSDVLHDISFEIKKGQMVALVGPSGGGKSTLVDLIPRFYEPQSGRITLDNIDLRDLDPKDLRRQIGYVTQEGVLFHDTVIGNIAYGDPQPDRERVMQAAKIANAHDFITALQHGYDTRIGERGTMLSGGQRQRIAIARAILRNPPLLILDEATSNLDTESEKLVQNALDNLMAERTSLVIAHRLSTIQNADLILVIENGQIVERGTHQELLTRGGLYYKLQSMQWAE